MSDLNLELKQLLIDALNLEDLSPDDIIDDAPLFGEGLGLDSIDALEIGIAIKQKYNILINADDENMHQHFASINHLAQFIQSQQDTK